MNQKLGLVKTYYVVVGKSVLGYCKTIQEAGEWAIDLKIGIFKRDADHIKIVEDWVEEDFYDDY